MAQRLAQTKANHNPEPVPSPDVPPDVKHCWYAGPEGRQAALVLKWRRVTPAASWEGYIAVARPDGGGWDLVTMWVDAGMLGQVQAT